MKNIKKHLILIGIASFSMIKLPLSASAINDTHTIESYGVSIQQMEICHQREWRNLSINLDYDTKVDGKAGDIQKVKDAIRLFLDDYSNPDDFWEVMNTNLVHYLADKFPDITSMNSQLSLSPDMTLHFPRESTVKFNRDTDVLKESFNFTKKGYLICQETFRLLDMKVSWEMKDSPNPTLDYPDYQWVDNAMQTFFAEYPLSYSEWKILKPKLQKYLLEQFNGLESIEIQIMVVE